MTVAFNNNSFVSFHQFWMTTAPPENCFLFNVLNQLYYVTVQLDIMTGKPGDNWGLTCSEGIKPQLLQRTQHLYMGHTFHWASHQGPPVYWVLRARPYQPSALTACSFVENQCLARGIFLNTMLFQYFCFDGHKDSKSSTQTGLVLNEMYKMWHLFSWFASKWQFTTIT